MFGPPLMPCPALHRWAGAAPLEYSHNVVDVGGMQRGADKGERTRRELGEEAAAAGDQNVRRRCKKRWAKRKRGPIGFWGESQGVHKSEVAQMWGRQ